MGEKGIIKGNWTFMVGINNRVTNSYTQGATRKQMVAPKKAYQNIQQPVPQTQVSFGEGFTLRLIEKFVPGVKKERQELEQTLKEKGKVITNSSKEALNSTVNLIVEKTPTTEPLKVRKPLISPQAAAALNADIQKKQVATTLQTLIANAKIAASAIADLPSKALALTHIAKVPTTTGSINTSTAPATNTANTSLITPVAKTIQPVVTTPIVPTTQIIQPVAVTPANNIFTTTIPVNNTVKPAAITMPGPPVIQNHTALAQGSNKPVATQPGSLNVVA